MKARKKIEALSIYLCGTLGAVLFLASVALDKNGYFHVTNAALFVIGALLFTLAATYGLYCFVRDLEPTEQPWRQPEKT